MAGSRGWAKLGVVAALQLSALVLQGCENALNPGSEHHVTIDYKCTEWQDHTCRNWKATGSVSTRKNLLCFPGDAHVITREGTKRMAAVRLGDELLSFNHATGQTEFSAVRAWLHRETRAGGDMTRVHTEAGDVVASPSHNLAIGSGETFAFARDLQVGDRLVTPEGSVAVKGVSWERGEGLFAPLTWTSTFFVGLGEDASSSVLAHSFAVVSGPQRFAAPLHTLLSMVEFFVPSIHDIDDSGASDYVHPVGRSIMRTMGIATSGEAAVTSVERNLGAGSNPPEPDGGDDDAGFLPVRRLSGHSLVEADEGELQDYIQVIIDHPPFMFDSGRHSPGFGSDPVHKDEK